MKKKISILLILVLVLSLALAGCGNNFEVSNIDMYKVNEVLTIMQNHSDMLFNVEYYSDGKTLNSTVTGAYVNENGVISVEYASTSNGTTNYGEISKDEQGRALSFAANGQDAVLIAINPSAYEQKIKESSMALSDLSAEEKQVDCKINGDGTCTITTIFENGTSQKMECNYVVDEKTHELISTDVAIYKDKDCTFRALTTVKYDTGYKMTHQAKSLTLDKPEGTPSTDLTIVFDGKEECHYGKIPKTVELIAVGEKNYRLYRDSQKENMLQVGNSGYVIKTLGIKQKLYAFSD